MYTNSENGNISDVWYAQDRGMFWFIFSYWVILRSISRFHNVIGSYVSDKLTLKSILNRRA